MLPKTNLLPLPGGADPTKWVQASDWLPLQLRNWFNFASSEIGGVPNPTNGEGTVDNYPAWVAAVAAATVGYGVGGGNCSQIYIPQGHWFFSHPLIVPSTCEVYGDGKDLTQLYIGAGAVGSINPQYVSNFAGPFMLGGNHTFTGYPSYTTPLVGATGQAMVLTQANNPYTCILLHDSSWWSQLNNVVSYPAFSLQLWFKITTATTVGASIIGSRGVTGSTAAAAVNLAFGVDFGGANALTIYFTTSNQGLITITGGALVTGTVYNLEINWDGAHVWCYLNGVNFGGNPVATGFIDQKPWEGVTIGRGGEQGEETWQTIEGVVDSIRLSNVARHTGAGGFAVPIAKYTWDTNTRGLFNFDQGAGVAGEPFVLGQAFVSPGQSGTYVPHYAYIQPGEANVAFIRVHDLALSCRGNASGLIFTQTNTSRYERIQVVGASAYGVRLGADAFSFFCHTSDIQASAFGIPIYSAAEDNEGLVGYGGGVSAWFPDGSYRNCIVQPNASSVYGLIIGGPAQGRSGTIFMSGFELDSEGVFTLMLAGALVNGQNFEVLTTIGNTFSSIGSSPAAPSLMYKGSTTGSMTHVGDSFSTPVGAPGNIQKQPGLIGAQFTAKPLALNCNVIAGAAPLAADTGFLTIMGPNQINNQVGLSGTDIQANNLRGTATVTGAATTATLTFTTNEADTSYFVTATAVSSTGGPAAGSNRVLSITKNVGSVVVNTEVAPGGAATVTFNVMIIR